MLNKRFKINGGWSNWSTWTKCSLACIQEHSTVESIRQRSRRCDSPIPRLGGKPCSGNEIEQEICSVPFCPINGGWSQWNDWSPCSATCGSGAKTRTRHCNNPSASHGGAYCDGNNSESVICSVQSCAGKKLSLVKEISLGLTLMDFLFKLTVVGRNGQRGQYVTRIVVKVKSTEEESVIHQNQSMVEPFAKEVTLR